METKEVLLVTLIAKVSSINQHTAGWLPEQMTLLAYYNLTSSAPLHSAERAKLV